ncbi:MAG: EscV/YscV/HrcV family type III secretion system export apparatus protein, partial [Hirschia sp.]|nr:EscV/YscV/HrcV family type III secretion system export apparatus protein [Hirschia sp.]
MAEATVQQGTTGFTIAGVNLNQLAKAAARGEIAMGMGVMTLIVMLIVPLPAFLLDFMLAISITASVLVLMTALLIKKPLEFSSFPTVLLLTTMLRLALNMASTRLILSEGEKGPAAAGAIIETFGAFVMQGNYVIGVIVFIILVIVNFVVITKGSGRIAEVAARFTLDAMPGKQMAIDADLSSGIISEEEAKARRKELEGESSFFGAMDGASKFVKGDAMAGIMITAINIIGGMVIGVAQKGLPFDQAANAYTTLTIGDGLVSQIPSLIISIAAGMLVSKAGVDGSANEALGTQLMGSTQGLSMVSGVALFAGLLPGMPLIPFTLLAAGTGYGAWRAWRNKELARVANEQKANEIESHAEGERKATDAPISDSLAIDELKVELGFGLLPLINETEGRKLTDQIKAVRRQVATEFGFVAPQVRIV